MGRLGWTLLLATAGVLAGCGDGASSGAQEAPALPVVVVDGEVQVSCGGPPGWSPSVMAAGIQPPVPEAEISAALDAVATQPGLSVETRRVLPDGGRTPWRVLAGDEDLLHLGLGTWTVDGPAEDAHSMVLERVDGVWTWRGHGDCGLRPLLADDDTSWAELTASDGTGTVVTVSVSERECTSGRNPEAFLREPVMVQEEHSVTVYWTTTPPDGFESCPGNPSVERTITLDEPLGDRRLLDGSTWPPRPVE